MAGTSLVKRSAFLLTGLFFMGLGIALVTRSFLGTPPISSVAYVLSLAFPITFGQLTFLFSIIFLLLEIAIIGRSFPKHQYLQAVVAFFFGIFVDVGMFLSAPVNPDFYAGRIFVVVAGCTVLALGIYLQVAANVIMNPGEGLVRAIADAIKVRFGIVKMAFDISLVSIAVVISFLLFKNITGIREGTLISMVLVGYIVLLIGGMFRRFGFEEWLLR